MPRVFFFIMFHSGDNIMCKPLLQYAILLSIPNTSRPRDQYTHQLNINGYAANCNGWLLFHKLEIQELLWMIIRY